MTKTRFKSWGRRKKGIKDDCSFPYPNAKLLYAAAGKGASERIRMASRKSVRKGVPSTRKIYGKNFGPEAELYSRKERKLRGDDVDVPGSQQGHEL